MEKISINITLLNGYKEEWLDKAVADGIKTHFNARNLRGKNERGGTAKKRGENHYTYSIEYLPVEELV